jgi:hypothetical protein
MHVHVTSLARWNASYDFADENVVALVARLKTSGQKSYATAYWDFLTRLGPMSSARQLGISERDAQEIRICLAGLK